jgi:hypothetical protein
MNSGGFGGRAFVTRLWRARYASDRLCMRYSFAVYASRKRSGRAQMFRLRLEDYRVRQRHASECLSLSPEVDLQEFPSDVVAVKRYGYVPSPVPFVLQGLGSAISRELMEGSHAIRRVTGRRSVAWQWRIFRVHDRRASEGL